MSSREEIIRGLYKNYKFLEEDFSKFREMSCLSSVENPRDGVKKLSYCVRQEVIEHGLIDTIKKIENAENFENAFSILHAMSVLTGYVFQGKDIKALANSEEYKGTFDEFIKRECITDVDSLNKREDIISEVFKSVLAIRLQSDEIKKYMQEQEQLETERIISKRYIYQDMPYSEEKIDEVIQTLSDEEKELIKRKERGVKLSHNENHKLFCIKIKIREILEKRTNKKVPQPRKNEEVQKRILQQRPPVNNNVPTIKEQKQLSSKAPEEMQSEKKSDVVKPEVAGEKKQSIEESDTLNENRYNIIAYKNIDAPHSLIDKEIAGLPERERQLIQRKGRISVGVFAKLLTPVEEEELKSILNKIRSNLGLEIMPQEKPKIISKTVVTRYKDIASSVGMSPEEWAAVKEKLSDNDKRIIKEKEEGKVLNPVDKNRCVYLVNSLKKGIIPKERLKKASIYEEVPYPKEEVDKLIERLSDNDKRIIKEKEEGNKLNRIYKNRYNYLKKCLKEGNVPKECLKKTSIYEDIPYPKEELDKLIERLSDNDKRIIKEKEEGNKLNRTDNHRYGYLKKCLKEGNIPKERLKKTSIYKDTPYPKEELDKLIEKLSDNDKRIIKEKEEGNKLNSTDNHRYHYLKKCLKKGIIPVRGSKKDSTTPTKEDKKVKTKNTRTGNRKSIYQTIPFSKELIDAAIDKLSPEQQELIKRKERGDKLTKNEIWRANNLARTIKIKLEKEEKTPISNKQLQEELSLYKEPINDDQTSKEESPKPKKRGGQRKELHEFFPGWSEEKIERSIEQLSDEDKAIVGARKKNQEMSAEDEQRLYYIIRKIKQGKIPREKKPKKEKLPISNIQLYEELSVPIEKPSMITIGINQVLSSGKESKEYPVPQTIPIQTSEEENDKLSTDYKRTLAEVSNNPIVIEEIDMTDIYMTGIRYGFLNGYPKKSIDEIAEWFGKTPDEVERITDEVLEKLYYVIVNNFKNTKQSDEKVFVKTGEKNQEE